MLESGQKIRPSFGPKLHDHRRAARCRSQLRKWSAIAFRRPSFAAASIALISSLVGFTGAFLRIRCGAARTGALETPFRLILGNRHSTLSGEKPSVQSSGWRKRLPGDFGVRSQRSLIKRSIDDRHCSTTKSSELIIRKYCSLRNASLSMLETKNKKGTLSSSPLGAVTREIAAVITRSYQRIGGISCHLYCCFRLFIGVFANALNHPLTCHSERPPISLRIVQRSITVRPLVSSILAPNSRIRAAKTAVCT